MSESVHPKIIFDRVDPVACDHCGGTVAATVEPFASMPCPVCGERITVHALLGQFVLIEVLGHGGMGGVYKGYDASLRRYVAVKVMDRIHGEDAFFVENFRAEACALAALNHPNVVQIYTYGETKGQPYIVMELVDGSRLDLVMQSAKPFDEKLALVTAIDVSEGLRAAHKIPLTHGDIKPANILYDRSGKAKVVDFGLTRLSAERRGQGEVWGTPYYISPEVVRRKAADHRSDIYSLGATLFHALTGHPPFEDKTTIETVMARVRQPAPRIAEQRPDLQPQTAAIIQRMLEADPFLRYPNYDSLIQDLKEALSAVEKGAAAAAPVRRKKKRSTLPWITGSCLLVFALVAVFFSRLEQRKQPAPAPAAAPETPAVPPARAPEPPASETKPQAAPTPAPAPAPQAAPSTDGGKPITMEDGTVLLTTAYGRGADAYVQGPKTAVYSGGTGFGSDQFLWLKAGKDDSISSARKIFLRFDTADLSGKPWGDAALKLTVRATPSNRGGSYRLTLWGIREGTPGEDWVEEISFTSTMTGSKIAWDRAPGNDLGRAGGMSAAAERLAEVTVSGNPSAGQSVIFSNSDSVTPGGLVAFANADRDGLLSFAVTADEESTQSSGWKFTAHESGSADAAPTLVLKPGAAP